MEVSGSEMCVYIMVNGVCELKGVMRISVKGAVMWRDDVLVMVEGSCI